MVSAARPDTHTRHALQIATDLTPQFIHIVFAEDREIEIIDLVHLLRCRERSVDTISTLLAQPECGRVEFSVLLYAGGESCHTKSLAEV
jgi:hypothetical protein